MTIELLDGSFVSPYSLFDALDTVEEYCGTEMRQYLESYFMDDIDPVDKDEHLTDVLGSIRSIGVEIDRELQKDQVSKKNIQYQLDRIRATIRHETGEE